MRWHVVGLGSLAVVALAGAAFVLVMLAKGCTDDPPPQPVRVDTVADTVLVRDRPVPPARTSLRERLIRRRPPSAVTVSAGTPDTAFVQRFAELADSARLWRDSVRVLEAKRDTVTPRPPRPRAVLPPSVVKRGHPGAKDSTVVWVTRSDGRMIRAAARLRGHWSITTGLSAATDTFPAFEDDAWITVAARDAVRCGSRSALLGGGARLLKDWETAALVAGGSLLACLL